MTRSKRRGHRRSDPYDGLLLVDKPPGFTSHGIVAKLRNYFSLRKVGHGGTLDPSATGLLVILIGKGTKTSRFVMRGDKQYEAVMRLGRVTDTLDAEGEILEENKFDRVTRSEVESEMEKWRGKIEQIPPMVAAIKRKGVPLYKLARAGKTVKRDPRHLKIDKLEMTGFDPSLVNFEVHCSKGTYIRALARDIGKGLGCGASLSSLRRTASGNFRVADASSLEEILECDRESLEKKLILLSDLKPNDLPGL